MRLSHTHTRLLAVINIVVYLSRTRCFGLKLSVMLLNLLAQRKPTVILGISSRIQPENGSREFWKGEEHVESPILLSLAK